MPMERLNPRPSFHKEKEQARNSEEALLAVLNSCACLTETNSKIDWNTGTIFGNWINRIKDADVGNQKLALKCLSYLNLEGVTLHHLDFCLANMHRSNFKKSRLTRAILLHANLTEANLTEATLALAELTNAILLQANLKGAILKGAILAGAILTGANLEGADLREANLEGTILEEK